MSREKSEVVRVVGKVLPLISSTKPHAPKVTSRGESPKFDPTLHAIRD